MIIRSPRILNCSSHRNIFIKEGNLEGRRDKMLNQLELAKNYLLVIVKGLLINQLKRMMLQESWGAPGKFN
jgi:hypothetical protein